MVHFHVGPRRRPLSKILNTPQRRKTRTSASAFFHRKTRTFDCFTTDGKRDRIPSYRYDRYTVYFGELFPVGTSTKRRRSRVRAFAFRVGNRRAPELLQCNNSSRLGTHVIPNRNTVSLTSV